MHLKSMTVGMLAGALFTAVALGSAGLGGRASAEPAPPYSQQLDALVKALERGNQHASDQADAMRDVARSVERAGEKCGR